MISGWIYPGLLVVRRFCCRVNSSIRYSFALSNNIKLFSLGVTRKTVMSTFFEQGGCVGSVVSIS